MENFSFDDVESLARMTGWNERRNKELEAYLDEIIANCKVDCFDNLQIDSVVLTTILKIYSKDAVNKRIEELQEQREKLIEQFKHDLKTKAEDEKDVK